MDSEQEEAMKNYMLSLSPDELTHFLLWRTEEDASRIAQQKSAFSDKAKQKILKQSDRRIALKQERGGDSMHQLSLFWQNLS